MHSTKTLVGNSDFKNLKMRLNSFTLLSTLLLLTSCTKEIDLKVNRGTPDFEVALDAANTYKAGEDVVFNFTGKAEMISFYSGELYREYDFRNGRTINISNPTLSFTSAVTGGTQTNQLSILASTDFNGIYN